MQKAKVFDKDAGFEIQSKDILLFAKVNYNKTKMMFNPRDRMSWASNGEQKKTKAWLALVQKSCLKQS